MYRMETVDITLSTDVTYLLATYNLFYSKANPKVKT